ncbi:Retrovirus-related Pol polyprotein from transposon 297,Retrovirus-related Pol polyprotein from transposon 17.6 [Mytilus coruscus]|uniref:Retrovirus-related Pol polyprotein from transposon 297,Retrovirus-related Pol polyprotein from transposon 17.6 n=1 Tax=Mytilus coruscus TaxID=42192 RepID=A0A6J8DHY1_MYTCO|nr:Retrovirus-related Pol polyprotein from transposon 297,Retrovirus-related Pol polyprotein from transposon 17.6 [Mytilus coruscus]
MPFGLCNAGATFSRLMQYILSGLQWEICVIYLDGIIVFSKSFEEHITRLQEVFDRIQLAGLKIAPKKCFIFQKKVLFLGHVVNAEGISPDPIKIEAVQSWPMPNNVKDVRSFHGTCSYYRKFIKDFSKIARPLHRLPEKNVIFKWNAECETAFNILKKALMTSPILTYSCIDKEFI